MPPLTSAMFGFQALDGFLVALTTDGNIIYVSDSVSSLIGHLPVRYPQDNKINIYPTVMRTIRALRPLSLSWFLLVVSER